MVLLTMTPAIVEALEKLRSSSSSNNTPTDPAPEGPHEEPSLSKPSIGKPISHGQVLNISKQLRAQGHSPDHLDILLRGSKVYIPPPPPKPEPVRPHPLPSSKTKAD